MMRHASAVIFFLLLLFFSGAGVAESADRKSRRGLDFFEKKIRPVLVRHCYECHSSQSKTVRGKLLLDTREGTRRGGESGPAVVPGKPKESLLISALRHEDFEMPPTGKLPDNVIADFVKWIRMGAPDPREGKAALPTRKEIDFRQARAFWAFRPLRKPPVPVVLDARNALSPIDRFIWARLKEKGLSPSPPATKRVLIRRLYFDLIGLPPQPEDVQRFLEDDSPAAVEKLVDRLLSSRHFGERWGRHWLDVARFAESSGGGRTLVYHLAWRYRDYVIEAYNRDKPFRDFVREQIAGDLLPWDNIARRRECLTATGFLMMGPTNYELQDKELLRMEVVDEQLDSIGRAFLGLTIGCARCHEHKFDPIPQEDYYALAGIFRSTHLLTPGNVSGYLTRPLPMNGQHARQLAVYEERLRPLQNEQESLKERLRRLQQNLAELQRSNAPSVKLAGLVQDDTQAELKGLWKTSASIRFFVGNGYRYSSGNNAVARYVFTVPRSGNYEVRLSYNAHPNRAAMAGVTVHHAEGTFTRRIDMRQPPPLDGLFVSLGTFRFTTGRKAVVELSARSAHGTVIADAVQLLSPEDRKKQRERRQPQKPAKTETAKRQDTMLRKQIAVLTARQKKLEAQLKEVRKTAPPPAPKVMAVADFPDASDYHLCIRGNVHKPGPKVPRGFLRVLWDGPPPTIPAGQSGRKQLADWLVSERNPLTPRVYVNRVWHHLFGNGIVRTVDNFGQMGERPSHPELLDWLAVTFQEDGWSTKKLIRRIVLSQTYQQAVRSDARAAAADPENRLFWRQNRRRLDAECLRDAMLLVSGRLDLSYGGPSIDPKVKSEFGYKHRSVRRSVYVPAFRNTVHPFLAVFDMADPNLVTGRRTVSTLPTQALYLMNSPFVMEQSREAAKRLLALPLSDDTARLRKAYEWTLGREPTKSERQLALVYLNQVTSEPLSAPSGEETPPAKQGAVSRQQAWATVFQALFASIDFRYVE